MSEAEDAKAIAELKILESIINPIEIPQTGALIHALGGKSLCPKCGKECEKKMRDGCVECVQSELERIRTSIRFVYSRVHIGQETIDDVDEMLAFLDAVTINSHTTRHRLHGQLILAGVAVPSELLDTVNEIVRLIARHKTTIDSLCIDVLEKGKELIEARKTIKRLKSPLESSEGSRILDL